MKIPLHNLLTALLVVIPLLATAADDLYVGEAELGEDQRVTNDALLRALDEVLVRLTGQTDRSLVEQLELGSTELNAMLQSQHMIRQQRVDADGRQTDQLKVRVEFDEQAVNQLLRDREMARWGRERPAILLWMVVEDDESARFVDDDYIESLVDEQARRLGLDVVRPLGDALDMAEVAVADVRGGFIGSSESAAERYGAGVIAMLDARQSGSERDTYWQARWTWRIGGRDYAYNHSDEAVSAVIRGGMERLAAFMAARFGVQPGAEDGSVVLLSVDGIVDSVQFAEVRRYLENLSIVDDVMIVRAQERRLDFELHLTGSGLAQFLEMGGLLVPEQPAVGNHLHYRLRR